MPPFCFSNLRLNFLALHAQLSLRCRNRTRSSQGFYFFLPAVKEPARPQLLTRLSIARLRRRLRDGFCNVGIGGAAVAKLTGSARMEQTDASQNAHAVRLVRDSYGRCYRSRRYVRAPYPYHDDGYYPGYYGYGPGIFFGFGGHRFDGGHGFGGHGFGGHGFGGHGFEGHGGGHHG